MKFTLLDDLKFIQTVEIPEKAFLGYSGSAKQGLEITQVNKVTIKI